MILDRTQQFIVTSIGTADEGAFLLRDLIADRTSRHIVCQGGYLRVFAVDGDRFLVAARPGAMDEIQLSVRRFAEPDVVLWSLNSSRRGHEFFGDPDAARGIRRHHLVMLKRSGAEDRPEHLILSVTPAAMKVTLGQMWWYDADHYDMGYQGPIDVMEMPDSDRVLVSVQRSSTLIVHDLSSGVAVDRIELGNRNGNPSLNLIDGQIWTVDYDTFVRVSIKPPRAVRSVLVQPADGGMGQWAADPFVCSKRRRAFVPRPYSGDIAVVDPDAGAIEGFVRVRGKPLSCVVTSTGRVIARAWRTGEWLEGETTPE